MKNFVEGYDDYKLLREKGYPEKASLKIVGDRYRLSRMERNALFRGVIAHPACAERKSKIVEAHGIRDQSIGIDWYNVLITVESYLRGMPVFISDDGMVRDSSATHGSYRTATVTERAQDAIFDTLRSLAPARIDVFVDSPIAFSAHMADAVRGRLDGAAPAVSVTLEHSADYPLKSYRGIVASSDSVVLDAAERICDLPRLVLTNSFGFTPPALPDLPAPAL